MQHSSLETKICCVYEKHCPILFKRSSRHTHTNPYSCLRLSSGICTGIGPFVPFGSHGCSFCRHMLPAQKKLKGINSTSTRSQSCWNFTAKADSAELQTAARWNRCSGNLPADFPRPQAPVSRGKPLGKETDLCSFHMAVLIAVSFHLS